MANNEFTVKQIKDFVKKDYRSVAARMVKSLLGHHNNSVKKMVDRKIDTSKMPDNYVRTKAEGINEGIDFCVKVLNCPELLTTPQGTNDQQ